MSEAEWRLLRPLIPPPGPRGRPREWSTRRVLGGVLYVLWSPDACKSFQA